MGSRLSGQQDVFAVHRIPFVAAVLSGRDFPPRGSVSYAVLPAHLEGSAIREPRANRLASGEICPAPRASA